MKIRYRWIGIALLFASVPVYGENCNAVSVRASVDVPPGDLYFSDLLNPQVCPVLMRSARHMRLGRAPLAGSERVFTPDVIRALICKAAGQAGEPAACFPSLSVPERVVVRSQAAVSRKWMRPPPGSTFIVRQSSRLIRPGDKAHLVWDQDGIRTVIEATSLDSGNEGDLVRARIEPSGRVLQAIVDGPGVLHTR